MLDLFFQGGVLFMSILSIINISMIILSIKKFYDVFISKEADAQKRKRGINEILEIGRFALIIGIFGQIIGLYSAFGAIEKMGGVSMEMLAGGLKVSSITTLYGFIIFIISYLFYFILNQKVQKA